MTEAWIHQERARAEYEGGEEGGAAEAVKHATVSIEILSEIDHNLAESPSPSSAAASKQLHEHLFLARLLRGQALLSLNRHEAAAEDLRAARELRPESSEAITSCKQAERGEVPFLEPPRGRIQSAGKTLSPPPVHFVTFASDPDKCELSRLLRSASSKGVSFKVLGTGVATSRWKNGMKLELLRDFARSVEEGSRVVVVDGYDVVLAGTAEEFHERFDTLVEPGGPKVVFQADFTFYCPLNEPATEAGYAVDYPPAPTAYRYLSSGGMMGLASDMAELVERVLELYTNDEWETRSDQSLFIRYLVDKHRGAVDGRVDILVDHHQVLFSGNGGRVNKDFDIVDGRLHHKVTGTFPVMFHAPGRTMNQREMMKLVREGWNNDVVDCGSRGAVK